MDRVLDPAALAAGRARIRANRWTALACGLVPAGLLAISSLPSAAQWAAGLTAGLLWASAFEYLLHRWILHWTGTYAAASHGLHHHSIGKPEEPLYVNLGGRSYYVVLMFAVNGGLVAALDWWLGTRFAPGMLVSFALYFVVLEEIHWRFHLGGWLPEGLSDGRARHLAHHRHADKNHGIFVPLWDRVFGTYLGLQVPRSPQSR